MEGKEGQAHIRGNWHRGFEFGDGGLDGGHLDLVVVGFGIQFGQLGPDVLPLGQQLRLGGRQQGIEVGARSELNTN